MTKEKVGVGQSSRSYPDRPWVGIGVVVWKGNDVLLVRRGKHPGKDQWSLPGGAQKLGETMAQAAQREVFEETGIEIRTLGVIDAVDFIDRDTDRRIRHHYTLVDLAGEWVRGVAKPDDDVAEVRWVSAEALPDIEMWDETRRVIRLSMAMRTGRK